MSHEPRLPSPKTRGADLTREKIAELRKLHWNRHAWSAEDAALAKRWLPTLLDLADEVERAKELSDMEPVSPPVNASAPPVNALPDGMETSETQRKAWSSEDIEYMEIEDVEALLRDFDRLLARETKAREEERKALVQIIREQPFYPDTNVGMRQQWVKDQIETRVLARTTPDPQSEIGLRAHLADLSARGSKP